MLLRRRASSRAAEVGRRLAASSLRAFLPPAPPSSPPPPLPPPPYLQPSLLRGEGRSVFIETYGCQMNVSDSEIVRSVLGDAGYASSPSAASADVVLLNTCAIRDGAEAKVWARLRELRAMGAKRRRERGEGGRGETMLVGVLGCMGERLKGKLLEDER